ncbi:MAG: tetratricopeptide repeat protein [Planctomycetaceae bacterium]
MTIASPALLTCLIGAALAQVADPPRDSVTLQLENGGRFTHKCTILDYDGREIRIRPESGRELTFPAAQVVEVQTPWTNSHEQGRELFEKGRFDDAAEAFRTALAVEGSEPHREWVRREILAELVRCALATGDYAAARQRFDLLVAGDRHTRHFGLIPLEWGSTPLPDRDVNDARTLLEKTRDAARLMGASVLLFDPKYGDRAEVELRKLLTSPDPHVAELAAAQQWRTRRIESNQGPDHLEDWQRRIEALPAELRGGPYYVLGRACFDRREYDRAATFLLWLPLVSPSDAHLAARAGVEAAEALALIGQKTEAIRVCHDVLRRFAHTPFAQDAQALLDSWKTEGNAP